MPSPTVRTIVAERPGALERPRAARPTSPAPGVADEKDARILPEMGVRVAFHDEASAEASAPAQQAVLVPSSAVQASGATGVVFVIRDNVLERRSVRLGREEGDRRVVLSGLTAGARVAIGDFALLTDGARIRIEP